MCSTKRHPQGRDCPRSHRLDGEHHFKILRVILGHRPATGIIMQPLTHDLGRFAFLRPDRLADHLPPGVVGDGLLVGERTPSSQATRGCESRDRDPALASLRTSASNRDLPKPASPTTATNAPCPPRTSSTFSATSRNQPRGLPKARSTPRPRVLAPCPARPSAPPPRRSRWVWICLGP